MDGLNIPPDSLLAWAGLKLLGSVGVSYPDLPVEAIPISLQFGYDGSPQSMLESVVKITSLSKVSGVV